MKLKIILLGCLSFIIALLATVPITLITPFIPANSPVQLSHVSGTIWSGQAKTVHYQKIMLGKLQWNIHPLAIFTGRLRSRVIIEGNDIQLDSLIDLHWDKSLELSQTQAKIEARFLQNFKQIPVKLGGVFEVNMTSVLIKNVLIKEKLPLMTGQLNWLKGEALSLPLGSYSLVLNVVNDEQHGTVSNHKTKNMPVDLSGKIHLDPQGNYQAKLKIKANKEASALLVSGISSLGRKEKDGFIRLDKKGSLQSLLP